MSAPLLNVEKLHITFTPPGGQMVEAVRGISFEIRAGEMLALVGESGSGKSVTGLAITRLLPDSAHVQGMVHWDGAPLPQTDAAMRSIRGRQIGCIFQEPMTALNPLHPIGKQIAEPLRIHRSVPAKDIPARVDELLAQVGLTHLKDRLDAYPHQLSGGERQRAMIAMAMACNPKLLIADEPTTALDVHVQAQIMQLLKKLQTEHGLAILLITHDMALVKHYAENLAVMQHGELVEQGTAADILAAPQHPYTQKLISALKTRAAPAPLAHTTPTLMSTEGLTVQVPVGPKKLFGPRAQKAILSGLSLDVKQGEALGVVGESGSGKTTAALALLRLIESTGNIWWEGKKINDLSRHDLRPWRADAQFVFQDPYASLNPRLTLGQSILEGLEVHREDMSDAEKAKRLHQALEEVGLTPDYAHRFAHELSGGQRQRIGLARALILEPKLIVLDEPTSALDVSTQDQVLALLEELQRKKGLSYILITHDWRVVRRLCHRVVVLKNGSAVERGETEALITQPQHAYTQALLKAAFL